MPKISSVSVLKEYRLKLEYDDGVSGIVDLFYLVGKGVFSSWLDPHVFEEVQVGSSGELVWKNGIDLCSDALYIKVTGRKPDDLFPALHYESTHA